MRALQGLKAGIVLLMIGIALAGCAPAAAQIQTYMGDVVPLSGYSYGGPYVYLFLTGPNLPPDGVALHNINLLASQGQFTRVDVDSDGHWQYKWATSDIGGKLDAGTYTIWVVDGPNDRSQLAYADYSTISVELSVPYISAGINGQTGQASQPGTMDITSTPDEAMVTVNNVFRGTTPLTLSGLAPGTYNLSLSKSGYSILSTPVTVESGSISEVTATLALQTGSIAVNTTPEGAAVTLDGAPAGTSPVTLRNLTPGNHALTLSVPGFPLRNMTVQVVGDQTSIADVAFVSPTTIPTPAPPAPAPATTRASGTVPAVLGGLAVAVLAYGKKKR